MPQVTQKMQVYFFRYSIYFNIDKIHQNTEKSSGYSGPMLSLKSEEKVFAESSNRASGYTNIASLFLKI